MDDILALQSHTKGAQLAQKCSVGKYFAGFGPRQFVRNCDTVWRFEAYSYIQPVDLN